MCYVTVGFSFVMGTEAAAFRFFSQRRYRSSILHVSLSFFLSFFFCAIKCRFPFHREAETFFWLFRMAFFLCQHCGQELTKSKKIAFGGSVPRYGGGVAIKSENTNSKIDFQKLKF